MTVPQAIKVVNEAVMYLYQDNLESAEVINRDGISVKRTEDGVFGYEGGILTC